MAVSYTHLAFHERTGEFHLYNREISYIMKLLPDGSVGQLYYGKRLRDREDYGHMLEYACLLYTSWILR